MRNKIIFILITTCLIAGALISNKKIKNKTVSVEKVDFKNYKLNKIEERIKVESEKLLEKAYKEEAKKKREEVLRTEEEQRKLEARKMYVKFEVSFYTTATDEGSGTGIGASGEYVQPWVSVAMPPDIPFYSTVYVEGLGEFINHDTGNPNVINWTYDKDGNLVCKIDVCVSTKEEAIQLGLIYAEGYILLNEN